jgi:hypothetical protein
VFSKNGKHEPARAYHSKDSISQIKLFVNEFMVKYSKNIFKCKFIKEPNQS